MRPLLIFLIVFIPFFAVSQIRIGNCGKWKYIKLSERDTVTQTCPGDMKNDWKYFTFEPGIPPLHIVVTDTFGNIELVRPFMSANFENFKPGFFRVYGLYYPFTYYLKPGKNIFKDTMGSYCYGFTENFVLINNNVPDPGEISLSKGNLSNLICPNAATDQTLQFKTNSPSPLYTYLLTNSNNLILAIQSNGIFDFKNLPSGKYYIQGLAYTGVLQAKAGQLLDAVPLSKNCFTKTFKSIEIEKKSPLGGEISLEDSQSSKKYFCTQFTSSDSIKINHSGDSYLNYSFLVMDGNNNIKGVEKESTIHLNKYPTGSYKIVGLSHLSALPNLINEPLGRVISLLNCIDISKNQIELYIENINVSNFKSARTKGDSIWCVNTPETLSLTAIGTGSDNVQLIWVATDSAGKVLGLNKNPDSIPMSRINETLFQFYALAFTGNLTLNIGDDINKSAVSTGCFDLSETFYSVRKKETKGGIVRFSNPNQLTNICLSPTSNYNVQAVRVNSLGEKYIYLLTNGRGEIINTSISGQFSINNLNTGQYSISGLSYTGSLSFGTGSRMDTTIFSNECYSLSENTLNFQKTITDGAMISFDDGQSAVNTCKGLKNKTFELKNNALITQKYAYALTNESGKIIQIEKGNTLQLNDSSLLVYYLRGIAYSGELTLKLGDNINGTFLSTGCHSLSKNRLTISFDDINAGTITVEKVVYCISPNEVKSIPVNITGAAGKYAWLLCDTLNQLIEVQTSLLPFVKRGLPGKVRIYGYSYLDQPSYQIGKSVFQQNHGISCFELTRGYQEVNWSETDGGNIAVVGSGSSITICQSDLSKPIQLSNTSNAVGDKYIYIIADKQQKLLATSPTNNFDLSAFNGGVYQIYGLSYSGTLNLKSGDIIPIDNSASECGSWSKNKVTVEITATNVGKISFVGEKDNVQICAKKNVQSLRLNPIVSNVAKKTFLLTNENGKIIAIFNNNQLPNIDKINDLVLRIYGLGYNGTLNAKVDSNILGNNLSSGCFQLSENFLSINRNNISGGFVSLTNNQIQQQICPTDSTTNLLTFKNIAAQGQKLIYLITNVNNIILDSTSKNSYQFIQQGIGDYRIYAFSYNGEFSGKIGVSINDPSLSEDCFGLSSNYISVAKRNPVAGFVVMDDANTQLQNCPSDATFPSRQIKTIGNNSGNQCFVIIDGNQIIVDILFSPTIYPTEYPTGKYNIVSISYNGTLNIKKGEKWGIKTPSTSCYSISGNDVSFLNLEPKGGIISVVEGDTSNICIGNSAPSRIKFTKDSINELTYSYLITDQSNRYLGHFTNIDLLSFKDYSTGNINVWGLSHTGNIILQKGDSILNKDISTGCFQLSKNSISLKLNVFRGHTVKTNINSDSLLICTGDGLPNLVNFSSSDSLSGLNYRYVLTTLANNIIQVINGTSIDFEAIGLREMRLYSVAFNGNFNSQTGVSIFNANLSSGCYKISDNFIKILRDRPANHRILFSNNDTIQKLCLSKSGSFAKLKSTFTGKTGYVYILLNKFNNIIMLNPTQNIDIEKLEDGDYQVYGLSYTGSLNLQVGNSFKPDDILATSCFRLSSNSVKFYKGGYAEGGQISTFLSSNTLFSCPKDGVADLIDISVPNNPIGTNYQFLITDSLNRLFYAPFDNQLINFDNTPAGNYRVYGIAYTGSLGFQLGGNILNNTLVNACFDLSDNYLEIYHNKPEAGQISKRDGTISKTIIAINNNQKDSILLKVTNAKPINVPYSFVLINENNMIVSTHNASFNLDTLKIGRYKIYGVASSSPNLSLSVGKSFSDIGKAENCIIISSNFLEVDIIPSSSSPIVNNILIASEKAQHIALSAFPNPVNDVLNVKIRQTEYKSEQATLRLTHISGKILFELNTNLGKGEQLLAIPMAMYPSGLYILTVDAGENLYTGKIIKTE
jgi:hypothetical protein